MKHKPLVSILINNYNKQDYCEKAIRSALYQSYKKIEIIFYDDFSNDLSLKRIQNLKIKFKNKLKIIKNKKRTEIFSFNQINGIIESLKKSKGKIICLMDSDDFFKKDKVKNVVNFFLMNPKEEILFDLPLIFKKNRIINHRKNDFFIRKNKWPKFPPTSCISFKKDSLKKVINKIKIKKFEDLWFDFRISTCFAINKNQFNILDKGFTYYRQYEFNYDKKFKKFINIQWWKRRKQAFDYILFINKKNYQKNIFSFDYIFTQLINKLFFYLLIYIFPTKSYLKLIF